MRQFQYRMRQTAEEFARLTGVGMDRILRRAGYPADFLVNEGKGVYARDFFAIWDAAFSELGAEQTLVTLARLAAAGPFNSAIFAFSCSPTVATGLERLALFKPLIGPMRLTVERGAQGLSVTKQSVEPGAPLPNSLAAFELAYLTELIRVHSDHHVIPIRAILPGPPPPGLDRHLGIRVVQGPLTRLDLSPGDARRRLVSENRELWSHFEKDLRRQLGAQMAGRSMTARVRAALLELLPAGDASADGVCRFLHLSRRTLQRRLMQEETTFKAVLDQTRTELAEHYLMQAGMNVEEIGYLLAYRDPNSFYRAFSGWTGKTPRQARQDLLALRTP